MDHSEEVGADLVVTGGDTAEVLQLGEEAPDEVTLVIDPTFNVVGLPDKAMSEAHERVRSAMIASGLAL